MIAGLEGIHAWTPPNGSGRYLTNPVKNPSFETNTTSWGISTPGWASGTLTRVEGIFTGSDGGFVGRVQAVKDATATLRNGSISTNTPVGSVEPGEIWSAALAMQAFDAPNGGWTFRVDWYTAASAFISSSPTLSIPAAGSGTAARRVLEGLVVPATASFAQIVLLWSSSTSGDVVTFDVDAVLIREGAMIGPYFPTASQLLSGRAKFTGTQHGSSSTLELPAIELGRGKDDAGEPLWPRFSIKRLTGLGSLGEPEDNRDRPPGGDREIPRLSKRRGKTVVYEGEVKARSLVELREAEAAFRAAFDGEETEGRMDVFWHPLLTDFAEVPPKFYEARALTADIIDVQGTTKWDRPYVVGLRMSDRRYFDEETELHSVEVKNTNTGHDFT